MSEGFSVLRHFFWFYFPKVLILLRKGATKAFLEKGKEIVWKGTISEKDKTKKGAKKMKS